MWKQESSGSYGQCSWYPLPYPVRYTVTAKTNGEITQLYNMRVVFGLPIKAQRLHSESPAFM
jgi:hypothetical protein